MAQFMFSTTLYLKSYLGIIDCFERPHPILVNGLYKSLEGGGNLHLKGSRPTSINPICRADFDLLVVILRLLEMFFVP